MTRLILGLCCAAGGLPHGWVGTNQVFRRIVNIDLSGNFLGHSAWPATDANRYVNTYGVADHWCLAGPATSTRSGFCPRTALNVAQDPLGGMPALVFLDLSDNGLQGEHGRHLRGL